MSMTYAQVQNEIIRLRFSSAETGIPYWVNEVQAEVWSMDEWTFRHAEVAVTATAGSRTLGNLPTDLGTPIGLWRSDGQPLIFVERRDFNDWFLGDTSQNLPLYWSAVNGVISMGPTPGTTDTGYTLYHQKKVTALTNPTDVSLLPGELHYGLLVMGAIVKGQQIMSDFSYQFADGAFQAALAALKEDFLVDQEGETLQFGRHGTEHRSMWPTRI